MEKHNPSAVFLLIAQISADNACDRAKMAKIIHEGETGYKYLEIFFKYAFSRFSLSSVLSLIRKGWVGKGLSKKLVVIIVTTILVLLLASKH